MMDILAHSIYTHMRRRIEQRVETTPCRDGEGHPIDRMGVGAAVAINRPIRTRRCLAIFARPGHEK